MSKSTMSNKKIFFLTSFLVIVFILTAFKYCYSNYQFWTHISTEDLNHLIEYRSLYIAGNRGRQILIHKDFLPSMNRINHYSQKAGVKLVVTESYRNPEKKTKNLKVEAAETSNHLAGHAIDINIYCSGNLYTFNDMKRQNLQKLPIEIAHFIVMIRKDSELRWGGDFSGAGEDPVHIDDGLNKMDLDYWDQAKQGCLHDIRQARYKWKFWV